MTTLQLAHRLSAVGGDVHQLRVLRMSTDQRARYHQRVSGERKYSFTYSSIDNRRAAR